MLYAGISLISKTKLPVDKKISLCKSNGQVRAILHVTYSQKQNNL